MIAAVMLVKDEADIISWTLSHLLNQDIDRIWVADNGSTDGTREILTKIAAETGQVEVSDDYEVGYFQDKKTTALARTAYAAGATWVLPCDADEIWMAENRTVGDLLKATGRDVQILRGKLLNHVPTALDDPLELNPVRRIGWRLKNVGVLPKVACRAASDLSIEMGNHNAHYEDDPYALAVDGFTIHHYSWRSEQQYLHKIRTGIAAFAGQQINEMYCAHWRMFKGADDLSIISHFRRWFYTEDPMADPTLVFDPAPSDRQPTLEES